MYLSAAVAVSSSVAEVNLLWICPRFQLGMEKKTCQVAQLHTHHICNAPRAFSVMLGDTVG